MSRLLFLAAVVAAVYLLLNYYRNRESGEKTSGQAEDHERAEDMVRCIYCGVHLPKSESVIADGKYYCSNEHRLAHQQIPANHDGG
ncbi:MAG TPA: PP0621 family protein [Gallionellaceae bacterium]|nr:PP0621 family protein [Gallionellaceae bacterium]